MIQCKKGHIELLDGNIILTTIYSNQELNLADVLELKSVANNLIGANKYCSIINCGKFTIPTAEAREVFGQSIVEENILARAIVIRDLGQILVAKHDIKNIKPKYPIQIFSELKNAKNWVRKFCVNNNDFQMLDQIMS